MALTIIRESKCMRAEQPISWLESNLVGRYLYRHFGREDKKDEDAIKRLDASMTTNIREEGGDENMALIQDAYQYKWEASLVQLDASLISSVHKVTWDEMCYIKDIKELLQSLPPFSCFLLTILNNLAWEAAGEEKEMKT